MPSHSQALVPIESWSYSSPDLRYQGYCIDIGLAAEALLYYDTVWINVANQPQLATFIEWFIRQGRTAALVSLLREGALKFYDYSFVTAAMLKMPEGEFVLMNMQDPVQAQPNSFEQRYLHHQDVQAVLPHSRERKQLLAAIRSNVLEAKAGDFGLAVENARVDERRPERNTLVVQAFVDALYRFRGLGHPPTIHATVQSGADGSKTEITWNVRFDDLAKVAGPDLNFGINAPLTANAISNRLLLSAAALDCDLFLGSPMSVLVGDKLYESGNRVLKLSELVSSLQQKVEFPDVRALVNDARLNLDDILALRNEAVKFRRWLQSEGDRDRDAIIAYHKEVAVASGLMKFGQSSLRLFGLLAAASAGTMIEQAYPGALGALSAATATTLGTAFLLNIADRLHDKWRPLVFGEWMQDRIKHVLQEFDSKGPEDTKSQPD